MRDAGRRHVFGLRSGAEWRLIPLSGSLWVSDGSAALDSGEPAPEGTAGDEDSRARSVLRGYILMRDREVYEPKRIGDRVCVGAAVIDAAYVDMVDELYPGATWEVEPKHPHAEVIAMLGEMAVAVVMPLGGAE
jgi:hypothetical protein